MNSLRFKAWLQSFTQLSGIHLQSHGHLERGRGWDKVLYHRMVLTWKHHLSLICWMRLRSTSVTSSPSWTRDSPCNHERSEVIQLMPGGGSHSLASCCHLAWQHSSIHRNDQNPCGLEVENWYFSCDRLFPTPPNDSYLVFHLQMWTHSQRFPVVGVP